MNVFDAVVSGVSILVIVMGFRAGLLGSLATILGYLIAAPVAVALTPSVVRLLLGQSTLSPDRTWMVLGGIFVVVGMGISTLLRIAVSELTGNDVGLFDRAAGALFGAVRIFLIAVLVVAVFDRIIPADREPPFLVGSRLRPYLSAAAQKGLQSLPPEIDDYIDRLKRAQGL
jgi:membrane protein required for colicin V production